MIAVEALKVLLSRHQVIPVSLAGNRLLLDANGVVVWPQQDMLIFSDLHLEKGSFLSQFANPLPRFDSKETLSRMAAIIKRYDCQHIVCLGDSLHDGNAISRMHQEDLACLNSLVLSVNKWTWVLGNHDPDIPEAILGERASYIAAANLLLVHEPEDITEHAQSEAQVIGHYHPKSSHKLANRKVTGKSFVCAQDIMLMPAFGKYTGGLNINDDAFASLFTRKSADVYLMYNHKIYKLP